MLQYFALKKDIVLLKLLLSFEYVHWYKSDKTWCECVLPQTSILSRSSSRYDFGDEDAGVVTHMWVVCSPCYAEAQAWVTLQEQINSYYLIYGAVTEMMDG